MVENSIYASNSILFLKLLQDFLTKHENKTKGNGGKLQY